MTNPNPAADLQQEQHSEPQKDNKSQWANQMLHKILFPATYIQRQPAPGNNYFSHSFGFCVAPVRVCFMAALRLPVWRDCTSLAVRCVTRKESVAWVVR